MRLFQLKDSSGRDVALYNVTDPEIKRIKIGSLFRDAIEKSFKEEQEAKGDFNFDMLEAADEKLKAHGIERVFVEAYCHTDRL